MSNENQNVLDQEEVKVRVEEPLTKPLVETTSEDPVVDPTGTFSDWNTLKESGMVSEEYGEKLTDIIPPPRVDEEGYKILNPNPNVNLGRPVYSAKAPRKGFMPLFNYAGTPSELMAALIQYDIHEQRKNKQYTDDHSEALDFAARDMMVDGYLWKSQWRPNSNWTNEPTLKGTNMAMGPTTTGSVLNQIQNGNSKLTTGLNNGFTLFHSAFSVRISTPTGTDLAELDAMIANERNVFGRRTGGALFASNRCFLESGILDLFIKCLDVTNIEGWTPEIVRKLIDERDMQTIAIALQAAKYPTAYPTMEPCTEAQVNCRNTREVSFSPMNSLIVDDAYFSPEEIDFLYSRSTKRTVKEIEDFQKQARWNQMKVVRVADNLEIRLKHPKAIETHNAGFIWGGSISSAINRVLGDDSPTRNRVNLMANLIDRESLRSFLPYVDCLIIDGTEKELKEEELIEIFSHLSDDPEIVRRFELDIRDFEERDIVAWMGIPRHLCTDCEKRLAAKDPQRLKEYMEHPVMVPQDAVSRFFTFRRL